MWQSLEVVHLVVNNEAEPPSDFGFSQDGQLVVIVHQNEWALECYLETFDRKGQRLADFTCSEQQILTMAFTVGCRLVRAYHHGFNVWDMRSGQQVGHKAFSARNRPRDKGSSVAVIAASRTGTKLAFIPAWLYTMFLYNAHRLQGISKIPLGGNVQRLPAMSVYTNLVWGVWGFMLVCGGCEPTAAMYVHTLLSLQHSADKVGYELVLQSEQQRDGPAILSPDGAFVATNCPRHGIRVYNARTGHGTIEAHAEHGFDQGCADKQRGAGGPRDSVVQLRIITVPRPRSGIHLQAFKL